MLHNTLGENTAANRDIIAGALLKSVSLQKLVAEEFKTQRECAEKMGMSEQQLSRSIKRPTAKFIAKLEKAIDKPITIIHGNEVQVIQGEKNNQLKTAQSSSLVVNELIAVYKSLLEQKDAIISDLREIINSQKEIIRSRELLKGG
jgi:transcriptional regulator with XRE-family HTH domain